jgi:hypothetical protein
MKYSENQPARVQRPLEGQIVRTAEEHRAGGIFDPSLVEICVFLTEQHYFAILAVPCGKTMGLEASVFNDPGFQFACSPASLCRSTWLDEVLSDNNSVRLGFRESGAHFEGMALSGAHIPNCSVCSSKPLREPKGTAN